MNPKSEFEELQSFMPVFFEEIINCSMIFPPRPK